MSKYERLARLMKIATLIKARGNLGRRDLAEKCEVSIRTIQRDINSLGYAGIPIFWSEEDKSYQIISDHLLPVFNLDVEEASLLIVAAKAFTKNLDAYKRNKLESAINKLVAVMPEKTRNNIQHLLEENFEDELHSAEMNV